LRLHNEIETDKLLTGLRGWMHLGDGVDMVTVRVIHQSSGKPAEGEKVSLYVSRFMASGVTDPEYTDSNGEAHFDVESTDGEVFVSGQSRFQGRLAGRVVVYV
jgi:5-hydroxyisourate hydrolase-like protein (transthyretin family)